MPQRNPEALNFLRTRRSRPAKTLTGPAPDRSEVQELLTIASRSPDHGKLEPWRFIVIEKPAMPRLAETSARRGAELGLEPEQIAKGRAQFDQGQLAVVVVEAQKPSEKIPPIEQTYAAGGVCLALLNAALAAGWGANWLTGWPSHDRVFVEEVFHLSPLERVAGLIHIGTETSAPPDRPRPDVAGMTTWMSD